MGEGVLIVDDDARFRFAARAVLEACGFSVVGEAADGGQALTAVRTAAPAVVLLDVQLPDIDGFEVASLLSLEEVAPAVVLVSSRPAAAYRHRFESSSVRGFIAKEELSGDALRAVLGWRTTCPDFGASSSARRR